jgi:hypothetical protein
VFWFSLWRDRAGKPHTPSSSRRASTTDVLQAGEGGKILVTPRPPASCSCRCRIARSMRRHRPPRRRAFIRPSKAHVARICFKCFKIFIRMLQVFHLDVVKVDLVLQLVFHMHVSYVSSAFRRVLQLLHPDVLKVDPMLHLCLYFFAASHSPQCLLLLFSPSAGHPPPPPPLLDAGVATCCSHLLQLLATGIRVRSGGSVSRNSPRAVGRHGPCVGRRRMQVRRGR